MSKLTESEKMKFWIDAEFSLLHIMFAVIAFMITASVFFKIVLVIYMLWSFVYMISRVAKVGADDPDYLSLTRRK